MSYGAPWEQGVGEANPTSLLSLEEPGLVPDASGSKALRGRYQCNKRQHLRREAVLRKAQHLNNQGMVAGVIEGNRQEMVCVSCAVDRCEATFGSDLAEMRREAQKEVAKERSEHDGDDAVVGKAAAALRGDRCVLGRCDRC